MTFKITTLIENTPGRNRELKCEHGLSFLIESDNNRLLLDTGKTGAFMENARILGKDLSSLDAVVLSHGHYDHAGGIEALAGVNSNFVLYTGKGFFEEKYGVDEKEERYIGAPFSPGFLVEKNIEHRKAGGDKEEIFPGIFMVTGFPRTHADEIIPSRFMIKRDGKFVKDLFDDEVVLVLGTEKGIVVLLGCSHPGVRNIIDHVRNLFDEPLRAVAGGTHLRGADEKRLEATVEYFRDLEMEYVGLSHCTGEKIYSHIDLSRGSFRRNRTGDVIIF